jgi:hypothetical protein
MNINEAMTVEASEQTAQDALVALQLEVERLRAIETRAERCRITFADEGQRRAAHMILRGNWPEDSPDARATGT